MGHETQATSVAPPKRAALLGILVLISVAMYTVVMLYTTWLRWKRSAFVDAILYPAFVCAVPLVAYITMAVQKIRSSSGEGPGDQPKSVSRRVQSIEASVAPRLCQSFVEEVQ